jgi:hypothetical protein
VPISYRGAPLSTLLHVSLIPTRHNRPSAYQLQRSTTEHSSTCKSHSHSHNRPSTYQLQRSATEHSSTCYCINFYTICWMYLYRLQIKWDHKRKIKLKNDLPDHRNRFQYTNSPWKVNISWIFLFIWLCLAVSKHNTAVIKLTPFCNSNKQQTSKCTS